MPELPEVETLKRQLIGVMVGKKISAIKILADKLYLGDFREIIGLKVLEIERKGKVLVIGLGTRFPLWGLLIHLKMTGQLIYETLGEIEVDIHKRIVGGHPTGDFLAKLPSSHTRVVIELDGNGVLFFNDQRKFGWVKLIKWDDINKEKFFSRLGPEPWKISNNQFIEVLNSRKPVKVRLMDQEAIAGIGNIYANDALWEAEIDPSRKSNSLSHVESHRLLQSVKMVLEEGIKYGGATAMDGKYVDLGGMGGSYQDHFRVYQRNGQACLRENCGGKIEKIILGGRGTFWCPICQK